MKSVDSPCVPRSALCAPWRRKGAHGLLQPDTGALAGSENGAGGQNTKVRNIVQGRVSDHPVKTTSEIIQQVCENINLLTKLANDMKEENENWNDVQAFQYNLISTLTREEDCLERVMNELKIKVQELENNLGMERTVQKM